MSVGSKSCGGASLIELDRCGSARGCAIRCTPSWRNLVTIDVSDLFGRKGRRELGEIAVPGHEREQVDSAVRLHDALDAEIKSPTAGSVSARWAILTSGC